MRSQRKITGKGLIPFAVVGVLFGIIYNSLFYPPTLVEYLEASTIGLLLGIATGISEQTFLKYWFNRQPFLVALILRTGLYAIFVTISLCLVLAIEPAIEENRNYLLCFIQCLQSDSFLRDLSFSIGFTFLITFFGQMVMLIGLQNFSRMLLGKYRHPREIFAVFMFVDLRNSTTIAEKLGHELFSAFLRDFFNDVAIVIQEEKGEIYQFVGDEVVIVWPSRRGSDFPHWLTCFKKMVSTLNQNAAHYRNKYGTVPQFKAGVHGGPAMITEIGAMQKAHVYHGDVLNTASRIQSKCNEVGFNLLASEAVIGGKDVNLDQFINVGNISLKGKNETVTVYGLQAQVE